MVGWTLWFLLATRLVFSLSRWYGDEFNYRLGGRPDRPRLRPGRSCGRSAFTRLLISAAAPEKLCCFKNRQEETWSWGGWGGPVQPGRLRLSPDHKVSTLQSPSNINKHILKSCEFTTNDLPLFLWTTRNWKHKPHWAHRPSTTNQQRSQTSSTPQAWRPAHSRWKRAVCGLREEMIRIKVQGEFVSADRSQLRLKHWSHNMVLSKN